MYIRAAHVGEDTEAAKIVRLVDEAPVRETKIQDYAEKWADDLVPHSFLGAGASIALTGSATRAASMLIIDYGTGIRVAAPTTVLAAMTKAARSGILIKGGRHLERLADLDAIVFDKTGTLTRGQMRVVEVAAANGHYPADRVLALAAAAEQRFTHPMALAVTRAADARGLDVPERGASEYNIGRGVEAEVEGRLISVGSCHFFREKCLLPSPALQRTITALEDRAVSTLCVAVEGEVIGVLGLADALRPEAREVVEAFRARGVGEVAMLTGDRPQVARHVAEALGITTYRADAFPDEKVAFVKQLQAAGRKVAVVGDGINDSPALAQADVGIAVYEGTDIARETANVVLIDGGLWKLPAAVDVAREAVSLIEQNWRLIWIPNTLAFGLAAFGALGPSALPSSATAPPWSPPPTPSAPSCVRAAPLRQPRSEVLERQLSRELQHVGGRLFGPLAGHALLVQLTPQALDRPQQAAMVGRRRIEVYQDAPGNVVGAHRMHPRVLRQMVLHARRRRPAILHREHFGAQPPLRKMQAAGINHTMCKRVCLWYPLPSSCPRPVKTNLGAK